MQAIVARRVLQIDPVELAALLAGPRAPGRGPRPGSGGGRDRQDFPGLGAGGLVRYLMGPGRFNEHTNQRVIASWDGAPELHQPPRTGRRAGSMSAD